MTLPRSRPKLRMAILSLTLGFTSACKSVGEDYTPPPNDGAGLEAWNGRLEGVLSEGDLDPEMLARWWTTLESPSLNRLVERARDANLDLRTASSQLRAARAQRQLAGGAAGPAVSGGAGANRAETDLADTELYSAGLDARWELDVFGGLAREIEAAQADYEAAREAQRDVLISVLAEVALNDLDLRSALLRRDVILGHIDAQEESYRLLERRLDAGDISELDLELSRVDLETTRAQVPAIDLQIEQIHNRLAVLLGQAPGTLEPELLDARELSIPRVEIAVGIPSEVLRRRPDVRRAERRLAAETARVGVAIAELYPKFSLSGSIGLESNATSSLFDSASQVFTLGSRMQWNLFDRGQTRSRIEIQTEAQEQALIDYERTVLLALEEVQNAISGFTQERIRYASLIESLDAAQRSLEFAQKRHGAGASGLLPVLDAQRSTLAARDELVRSEGTILGHLVRLYKALGGGWDPGDDNES